MLVTIPFVLAMPLATGNKGLVAFFS